ncbi:MAG: hypothetical protein WCJ99_14960 [Betaproteobacteria bacterium]|jgi:hypothetical protein
MQIVTFKPSANETQTKANQSKRNANATQTQRKLYSNAAQTSTTATWPLTSKALGFSDPS